MTEQELWNTNADLSHIPRATPVDLRNELSSVVRAPPYPDVCILCPSTARKCDGTNAMLAAMYYHLGWPNITVKGGMGVDRVRCQLTSLALQSYYPDGTKPTYFVFTDDDNWVQPNELAMLVNECRDLDLDCVWSIVPVRRIAAIVNFAPLQHGPLQLGDGGGLVEVKHVGAALGVVHRRMFERMDALLPATRYQDARSGKDIIGRPYFLPMIAAGKEGRPAEHYGEDYAWCARARATGSRIWVDTRIVGAHEDPRILTLADIAETNRRVAEEMQAGRREAPADFGAGEVEVVGALGWE